MRLASAECFAADGARVGNLGRTQGDLDAAVERLNAKGLSDAAGFACDIGEPEQIEAAFAAIDARWPHFNAAGGEVVGDFESPAYAQ